MNPIPRHGRLRPPNVRRLIRRRAPASRGQAIVELALILPVLLILLASALDLGRLFYSQITVNDAAREGVLEASRNPTSYIANTACTSANKDANRIMCRTINEAKGGFVEVTPADVTLTCSTTPCPPTTAVLGNTISVKVTGHFRLITPLLAVFFGGQAIDFSSTSSAQLLSVPVTAVTGPVASFTRTPTSGTAPLAVAIVDTSTNLPTTWAWGFGDGQTFNGQFPPAHSYATPGTYTITLTVSNVGGTSTVTHNVTVTAAIPVGPTANFNRTPIAGSVPLNVTFTDTSTGTPTSWAWNFGDGTTSTLQSPPVHTYSTVGVYTVSLTVANAGGSNTVSKTVNAALVCPVPVSNFTVNPNTGKKKQIPFVVTDHSTNLTTAGCNNTWSWNFGDGSGNSSLQNPPGYLYNSAGVYTIQLTVSTLGGSSTSSHQVTATP
jgi:PKD repeat protein